MSSLKGKFDGTKCLPGSVPEKGQEPKAPLKASLGGLLPAPVEEKNEEQPKAGRLAWADKEGPEGTDSA